MDNKLVDVSISVPIMSTNQEGSNQDDISRRIKNRERQRRYRERKRLLADLKKAQGIDISVSSPRSLSYEETPKHFMTRVLCRRDWKKDARRAHLLREEETGSGNSCFPETVLVNEGQSSPVCSGNNQCDETRKHIPSRRQWKADARNKKS